MPRYNKLTTLHHWRVRSPSRPVASHFRFGHSSHVACGLSKQVLDHAIVTGAAVITVLYLVSPRDRGLHGFIYMGLPAKNIRRRQPSARAGRGPISLVRHA